MARLDTDGGFNGLSLRERMANGLRSVRCRRRGHGRRIRRLRGMDGRTAPQLIRIAVGGQKASRPSYRAFLRPTELDRGDHIVFAANLSSVQSADMA